MPNNVNVAITPDQIETLCKHFGKDPTNVEDYEVGEMVDQLIDEIVDEEE